MKSGGSRIKASIIVQYSMRPGLRVYQFLLHGSSPNFMPRLFPRRISANDSMESIERTVDWTRLQVMDQAPSTARFAEIHLVSAWNDGSAWLDDVRFD